MVSLNRDEGKMNKYELFLKELTELCRKHDVAVSIDCHSVELSLISPTEWKAQFPTHDTILEKEFKLTDEALLNFGLR